MKKGLIVLGVIVILLVIIVGTLVGSYNGFVNQKEEVGASYAQVENQMQRRFDLIPNLVSTVKGYTEHESEVLGNIAEARANYAGASSPADLSAADASLSSALSRLLVIVENYPDLKADTHFTQLMDELAGTENRLATARRDYNEIAKKYNAKTKRFPGSIIAKWFDFTAVEYFEIEEAAKKAPTVDFSK